MHVYSFTPYLFTSQNHKNNHLDIYLHKKIIKGIGFKYEIKVLGLYAILPHGGSYRKKRGKYMNDFTHQVWGVGKKKQTVKKNSYLFFLPPLI